MARHRIKRSETKDQIFMTRPEIHVWSQPGRAHVSSRRRPLVEPSVARLDDSTTFLGCDSDGRMSRVGRVLGQTRVHGSELRNATVSCASNPFVAYDARRSSRVGMQKSVEVDGFVQNDCSSAISMLLRSRSWHEQGGRDCTLRYRHITYRHPSPRGPIARTAA